MAQGPSSIAAVVVLLASTLVPAPAAAQDSNFALVTVPEQARPGGWTFTPSLLYQGGWDDNVLLRTKGDQAPADFLNIINPRADVNFRGRHSELDANYDGAFLLYRDLNALNSYEQHGRMGARQRLSPHITLFARNEVAVIPTTELVQLVAVPFVRTGATYDDLQGGLEAALTKVTSLSATYNFEWVRFDPVQALGVVLRGGHSHGGNVTLRHRISVKTMLVSDFDMQRAQITDGGTFNLESASAGVEYTLSTATHLSAAAGVSHLNVSALESARTGPLWRLGLFHRYRTTTFDVRYSRSYVPSFGFGGTSQNEEALALVHVPLARRMYARSETAWRRNDPLTPTDPNLSTYWVEAAVGYLARPWMQLEVFYSDAHQNLNRPGGVYNRNRVGFQMVTSKPMRIR
jgi:hypothetical protein